MKFLEYIDGKKVILNRDYIIPMESDSLDVVINSEYTLRFRFSDFTSKQKEKKEFDRISMTNKSEKNTTEFTLRYGADGDEFGLLKKPIYILSSRNESSGKVVEVDYFILFLVKRKSEQCLFFKLQILSEIDSSAEQGKDDITITNEDGDECEDGGESKKNDTAEEKDTEQGGSEK